MLLRVWCRPPVDVLRWEEGSGKWQSAAKGMQRVNELVRLLTAVVILNQASLSQLWRAILHLFLTRGHRSGFTRD